MSREELQSPQLTRLEYLERLEESRAATTPHKDAECCICTEKMEWNTTATKLHNIPRSSARSRHKRSPRSTSRSYDFRKPRSSVTDRRPRRRRPRARRTSSNHRHSRKAVWIDERHYCCEDCISSWSQNSNKCPLCRKPLFIQKSDGESLELRLDNYMRAKDRWNIQYSACGRMVQTLPSAETSQVVVDGARTSQILWYWWWETFTARNKHGERCFVHHPVASALLLDMLDFVKSWEGATRDLLVQRFCAHRSIEHRSAFWRETAGDFGDPLRGLDEYVEDLIEATAQAVVCRRIHGLGFEVALPLQCSGQVEAWMEKLPRWEVRQKAWLRDEQE